MNNLSNEFVWEVKTIQKRGNQFSTLQKEMLNMKREMEELKSFFTNKIIQLEQDSALLRAENLQLKKELNKDITENINSGVLFQKTYLNID